jgi:hypothetical protein
MAALLMAAGADPEAENCDWDESEPEFDDEDDETDGQAKSLDGDEKFKSGSTPRDMATVTRQVLFQASITIKVANDPCHIRIEAFAINDAGKKSLIRSLRRCVIVHFFGIFCTGYRSVTAYGFLRNLSLFFSKTFH